MDFVVAYDIAETDGAGARRLRKIGKVCEKYGERVQFSVFECRLSPTRFERMMGEVQDIIDTKQDSVLVYRFPGRLNEWRLRLGKNLKHEIGQPWIM